MNDAKYLLVITPTRDLFIEWLAKNNVSIDDPRVKHVRTRDQAYGYVDFIAVNYANAGRDVDCWGALRVVHMMEKAGRGQLVPNGSPLLEQFKKRPAFPAPTDEFAIRGHGTVYICTLTTPAPAADLRALIGRTIILGGRSFDVRGVETYVLHRHSKSINVGFLGDFQ